MPLDILQKIQGVINDGNTNTEVKGQIAGAIDKSSQDTSMRSGLSGIANAITGNGTDLAPETLAKLACAATSFSAAMERANLASLGIHGSIHAIDTKPLETASETLGSIAENSNIHVGIGTRDATSAIASLVKKIEKLRVSSVFTFSASIPSVKMPKSVSQPQKFANGGKVTYHGQNTETARTGGIFRHGSKSGDRNMIFANKGEGIVTARAITHGAKQHGVSPERYVQELNNPSANLDRIKRGRSFKYGGFLESSATPTDFEANAKFTELLNTLKGNKFHGKEKDPSGVPYKNVFDAFARATIKKSGAGKIENLKKNDIGALISYANKMISTYENQVSSKISGIQTSVINKPSSLGGSKSVKKGITLGNKKIESGEIPASASVDSAGLKRMKSAASSAQTASSLSYKEMDEETRSSEKGVMQKAAKEGVEKIANIFSKLTTRHASAMDEIAKKMGIKGGIGDLEGVLADFQSKFNGNEEEVLTKIEGWTTLLSHINLSDIDEKLKEKIDKLKSDAIAAIDSGMPMKRAINRSQAIDIEEHIKTMLKKPGLTDKEKTDIKEMPVALSIMKKSDKGNKIAQHALEKEFGAGADFTTITERISRGKGAKGSKRTHARDLEKWLRVVKAVVASSELLTDTNDDLSKSFDNQVEAVQKVMKNLSFGGAMTDTQIAKNALWIASIALVGKGLRETSDIVAGFSVKQAELSKNFDIAAQSANTFTGKSYDFEAISNSLNLSREQAVELGQAMQDVGLKGIHSVSTVTKIADNLKDALGKVDMTLLKEATQLINDLPKEQVDVMINGVGSFDDKANLIANLMNDGNLEKSINLMMKGAFGEMEGSVKLDEKDKAVIEVQEKANLILDEINKGIYSLIPKGIAANSVFYSKMLASLVKQIGTLYTLFTISRNVASIAAKQDAGSFDFGKDLKGLKGFGDKIKNFGKGPGGNFSFKTFGSNTLGGTKKLAGKALGASGIAAGMASGIVVAAVMSAVAKGFENVADKRAKKEYGEYRKNRQNNIDRYGNTVGYEGLKTEDTNLRNHAAATTAKAMGVLAGAATAAAIAATAAGIAIGTFTAGIGTAVGLTVAGLATLTAWAVAPTKEASSSFTHEEARGWYNPARWLGENTVTEEDEKSEERKENYEAALKRLDKTAKARGEKELGSLLKELVALNKHVKSIDIIVKGRLTAFDENNFNSDMDMIKQFQTIGGTGEDFSKAKRRAFGANTRSYSTQVAALSDKKAKILNDKNMGVAAQANALNKVIQDETKMHQKFIDNMLKIIDTLGETPEVIVGNLKQQLNNVFSDFNSKGFLNNAALAKDDASRDTKTSADSIGTIFKDFQDTKSQISHMNKVLEQNMAKNQTDLQQMQKDTGFTSGADAEAVINSYAEKINAVAPELAGMMASLDTISEIGNKAQDASKKAKTDEDQKVDVAVADEMRNQLDFLIENVQSVSDNAKEGSDLKTEADVQLANLQKLKKLRDEGELTNEKLVAQMGSVSALQVMLKDSMDKAKKDAGITEKDEEGYAKARTYVMTEKAGSSIKDQKVANQKLQTEAGQQYIKKIEEQANKFIRSLDAVLNNGAVQFAKSIKEALAQSEEYDMFGGGKAVLDTIEASIAELEETMKSVKDAKELAAENLGLEDIEKDVNDYFASQEKVEGDDVGNLAEQELVSVAEKILEAITEGEEKPEKGTVEERLKEKSAKNRQDGVGVGEKYMQLVLADAKAKEALMKNPHGEEEKSRLKEAGEKLREFENSPAFRDMDDKTKQDVKAMSAMIAAKLQAQMKVLQADAAWKTQFMTVFKQIPQMLDKIVMSGRNLALAAKQGAFESKQTVTNKYGSVSRAIGMRGGVMANAGEVLRGKMASIDNDETVKAIEEMNAKTIALAKQDPNSTPEQIDNLEETLNQRVVQAKFDAETKAKDEYIQSLEKAMEASIKKIERSTSSLETEMDLYETIGAPFEYILDIEQELVRNAKARAEAQEEILASMEAQGIQGEAIEEQKLKVQKASAEVIKASFGAQRDALDKLLGKMMGGFEQIGGIFGPDSDFMKARKAGQGYTQLPSGMISASGSTVTDYADRVMGLGNAVKTHRGQAEVFGGGSTIPPMADGGLVGDWISKSWKKVNEGMNTSVGGLSGDTGNAITPSGNKVRMNRGEAVFNYDTLTALAEPLKMSPQEFVAKALSGRSPYENAITHAQRGWTDMSLDVAFGTGKDRFKIYDDSTKETAEEIANKQIQDNVDGLNGLGAVPLAGTPVHKKYSYKDEKWVKNEEDNASSAKKVSTSGSTGGSAIEKITSALQNSAFGGFAENDKNELTTSEKLLESILKDTNKIVQAMGISVEESTKNPVNQQTVKNTVKNPEASQHAVKNPVTNTEANFYDRVLNNPEGVTSIEDFINRLAKQQSVDNPTIQKPTTKPEESSHDKFLNINGAFTPSLNDFLKNKKQSPKISEGKQELTKTEEGTDSKFFNINGAFTPSLNDFLKNKKQSPKISEGKQELTKTEEGTDSKFFNINGAFTPSLNDFLKNKKQSPKISEGKQELTKTEEGTDSKFFNINGAFTPSLNDFLKNKKQSPKISEENLYGKFLNNKEGFPSFEGFVKNQKQNANIGDENKTSEQLRKEIDKLYGDKEKSGKVKMSAEQIARVSQKKDILAGRKLDAIQPKKSEKTFTEQSIDIQKEILAVEKLIYKVLLDGKLGGSSRFSATINKSTYEKAKEEPKTEESPKNSVNQQTVKNTVKNPEASFYDRVLNNPEGVTSIEDFINRLAKQQSVDNPTIQKPTTKPEESSHDKFLNINGEFTPSLNDFIKNQKQRTKPTTKPTTKPEESTPTQGGAVATTANVPIEQEKAELPSSSTVKTEKKTAINVPAAVTPVEFAKNFTNRLRNQYLQEAGLSDLLKEAEQRYPLYKEGEKAFTTYSTGREPPKHVRGTYHGVVNTEKGQALKIGDKFLYTKNMDKDKLSAFLPDVNKAKRDSYSKHLESQLAAQIAPRVSKDKEKLLPKALSDAGYVPDKTVKNASENNANPYAWTLPTELKIDEESQGAKALETGDLKKWQQEKMSRLKKVNNQILDLEGGGVNDNNRDKYTGLLEQRKGLITQSKINNLSEAKESQKTEDEAKKFVTYRAEALKKLVNEKDDKRYDELRKRGISRMNKKEREELLALSRKKSAMIGVANATNWEEFRQVVENNLGITPDYKAKHGGTSKQNALADFDVKLKNIVDEARGYEGQTQKKDVKELWSQQQANLAKPTQTAIANARLQGLTAKEALQQETDKKITQQALTFDGGKGDASVVYKKEVERQKRIKELELQTDGGKDKELQFLNGIAETDTNGNSKSFEDFKDSYEKWKNQRNSLFKDKAKELGYYDETKPENEQNITEEQHSQIQTAMAQDKDYAASTAEVKKKGDWFYKYSGSKNVNGKMNQEIATILKEQKDNEIIWAKAFSGGSAAPSMNEKVKDDVWDNIAHTSEELADQDNNIFSLKDQTIAELEEAPAKANNEPTAQARAEGTMAGVVPQQGEVEGMRVGKKYSVNTGNTAMNRAIAALNRVESANARSTRNTPVGNENAIQGSGGGENSNSECIVKVTIDFKGDAQKFFTAMVDQRLKEVGHDFVRKHLPNALNSSTNPQGG